MLIVRGYIQTTFNKKGERKEREKNRERIERERER